MQRLIVTSATYRQSSHVSAELLEKDPENRLLARGPRFRLPAEMVRDNALAASRLLNREDRRPERVSLSAAGALGGTVARRDVHRAGVSREPGRGSLPPQHVHLLEAHRAARRAHHLRRARPREVHLAPPDHQHAVAGAGAAQRSDLCGSRARAGAARASRKRGSDPQARVRFLFREATARRATPAELRVLLDLAQRRARALQESSRHWRRS